MYSNCVSVLTNGSDVVEFSSAEMRTCNTALNDAIRRVFSYQRWESIRQLRQTMGYPNIYDIFSRQSKRFLDANLKSRNSVIRLTTAQFIADRYEQQ